MLLHVERPETGERVRIDDPRFRRWAMTMVGHNAQEQLRVIYLDRRHRLLADVLMAEGTVDEVACFPTELVHHALDLGASGFVVVHNHPSGDPTPTQADVAVTRKLAMAATALDLTLHDHVIVARNGFVSFRSRGLLR